jgi:hypothetical protein
MWQLNKLQGRFLALVLETEVQRLQEKKQETDKQSAKP